jgi:ribose 5-phosphate isomerase B
MKIYLGADHNGFAMRAALAEALRKDGHEIIDEGDQQFEPEDDFPQFAEATVRAMLADDTDDVRGILICGSGQGMCIAANRFKGIRASLCWDVEEARAARNDDDSNVLCLPARPLNTEQALAITEAWLATPFAGASRFKRRIQQLDQLVG